MHVTPINKNLPVCNCVDLDPPSSCLGTLFKPFLEKSTFLDCSITVTEQKLPGLWYSLWHPLYVYMPMTYTPGGGKIKLPKGLQFDWLFGIKLANRTTLLNFWFV